MVFKTISMTIIAMATLGVLPSYGLQPSTSADVSKSALAQSSSSAIPIETTKSNSPYTLLADNASLGREVDAKAEEFMYGSTAVQVLGSGGLPVWKHWSDEQKARLAYSICRYEGDNTALFVHRQLGGGDFHRLHQASAIALASMHTLCPNKYRQVIQELPSQLLR